MAQNSINNSSTITITFPLESKEPDCSSFLLLAAMVFILSMCIITIVVCYLYSQWNHSNTLTQTRRLRRRTRVVPRARRFSWRSPEFLFSTTAREGLSRDVIDSLPVFVYKPEDFKDGLSCSVCLSEFEENDKGKILPSCNHRFHVDCVDMWLNSHSTCPLCRARVEKKQSHEQVEVLTGEELNDKEMVNSRNASGSTVQGEGVDNGEGSVKKEEQAGVAIDIH